MKKLFAVLGMLILFGCSTNEKLIYISDISIAKVENNKITKLYLLKSDISDDIYNKWCSGIYGDNIVTQLDTLNFKRLSNKAVPCNDSLCSTLKH